MFVNSDNIWWLNKQPLKEWKEFLKFQMLWFTPIFFLSRTYFSFSRDYSSLSRHRPADYTCLHNRFLPSVSSDFSDSSLLTHMYFFAIPSHSTMFLFALSLSRNFPSLRYINPRLTTYSLKLDLLCTLVHCHTNLVLFSFSCLWLFVSLRWCSEPVTCPRNLSPMPRKSLGCIFEPSTLT